jgi:hypothetical protein
MTATTDLHYLLFPIWQREYSFSFALIGVMKTLFSGALSLCQVPAARLAGRLGEAAVLAPGTFLPLFGLIGDAAGLTLSIGCVACLALAAVPLAIRFGYVRRKEAGRHEL